MVFRKRTDLKEIFVDKFLALLYNKLSIEYVLIKSG